jgi:formylglycine-generating enzyme required for sulfatase activity
LLYIDTDAIVDRPPSNVTLGAAPRGMITRARISFLDDMMRNACDQCVRDFVLDERTPWPLSLGVAPPTSGALYVRVRLFKSVPVSDDGTADEREAGAVDVVARLQFSAEITRQMVFAPFGCLGVAFDPVTRTTCGPTGARGPLADTTLVAEMPQTRINTWRASYRRDCMTAPRFADQVGEQPEARVCIPGGSYWMGNSNAEGEGPAYDAIPEHPVTVSPFHLDRFEYTVGRYRQRYAQGFRSPDNGIAQRADNAECNLVREAPGDDRDGRPLNCVTWTTAKALCALDGGRLPTEAEWEWAARSRDHGLRYPWGDDRPSCGFVPGLNPCGNCEPPNDTSAYCRYFRAEYRLGLGAPWWRYVQFSDARVQYWRDQTRDGVYAMAGSLDEWTADRYQFYSEPCWSPVSSIAPDPQCAERAPLSPEHQELDSRVRWIAVRSSNSYLASNVSGLQAAHRSWGADGAAYLSIGFRCAYPDR